MPEAVFSGKKAKVATWSALEDRKPSYALVANVDLVVVRFDDKVSVLYGRCLHRGALLSDGFVKGEDLVCGVHAWDYRVESGISAYSNNEVLPKFQAWINTNEDSVFVDEEEIRRWEQEHPQAYSRSGLPRSLRGSAWHPAGAVQRIHPHFGPGRPG